MSYNIPPLFMGKREMYQNSGAIVLDTKRGTYSIFNDAVDAEDHVNNKYPNDGASVIFEISGLSGMKWIDKSADFSYKYKKMFEEMEKCYRNSQVSFLIWLSKVEDEYNEAIKLLESMKVIIEGETLYRKGYNSANAHFNNVNRKIEAIKGEIDRKNYYRR